MTETASKDAAQSDKTPPAVASIPANMQRVESKGEKDFGFIRDRVINLGINEIGSLWATDQFVRGSLKPKCDKWCESYASRRFNKITYPVEHAKAFSDRRGFLLTVILNQGGNILLGPMLLMEHYKSSIVQSLNHVRDYFSGNKLSAEEVKARDDDVAKHIESQPKVSWKTLVPARIIAMSSNFVLNKFVMGGERTKKMEKISGHLVDGITRVPDIKILNKLADNEQYQGMGKLALLETLYCMNASFGMEALDKIFANSMHKKSAEQAKPTPTPTRLPTDTERFSAGGYGDTIKKQNAKAEEAQLSAAK